MKLKKKGFSIGIKGLDLSPLKSKIGQAVRMFANGPGDLGLIPGRVIPKTKKKGT